LFGNRWQRLIRESWQMYPLDTADGVLMVQAYSWALVNPLRKLFYNIVLTCLSVAVALFIGTAEGLQVVARVLSLHGRLFGVLNSLDYSVLGFVLVGVLLAAWGLSALVWRSRRHVAGTSPLST
jgi:nickel/cobalt transporter (NiCoT) family protein